MATARSSHSPQFACGGGTYTDMGGEDTVRIRYTREAQRGTRAARNKGRPLTNADQHVEAGRHIVSATGTGF